MHLLDIGNLSYRSGDRRQMETLMAPGLSPEKAVDSIVRGVLR